MGKLPYFEFYPSDWTNDTSMLPLKIKGAWIDILCGMWWNGSRGELTGSWEDFSRYLRVDVEEAKYCVQCLITYKICDVNTLPNGNLTLISRRIKKDEKKRINNKLRQYTKYHKDKEKQEPHTLLQKPHNSLSSSSSSSSSIKENNSIVGATFFECPYFTVNEQLKNELIEIYNIDEGNFLRELKRMKLWLDNNPKKRKKRYVTFIENWLRRSSNDGGSGIISNKREDPFVKYFHRRENGNAGINGQGDRVVNPDDETILKSEE